MDKLEQLGKLYKERDRLTLNMERMIDDATPDDVKEKIKEIKEEFEAPLDTVSNRISALELDVQESVKALGRTVKGSEWMAVYNRGRVTWKSEVLDALAITYPTVLDARKEGSPYVVIKRIPKGD